MLDYDVLESQPDSGSVTLFVPEEEYETIEVPEAVRREVVSPRSILLGVNAEVLENTLFTRVKMSPSDFSGLPRRSISLLFVKKEIVAKMPQAIACISPAFLVLGDGSYGSKGFFIGQTEESRIGIKMLLRDNYLLLPLYLTSGRRLNSQGVDIALRNFYGNGIGKLWAKSFICEDIYLFGQSYFNDPKLGRRYMKGRDLHSLWRMWNFMHNLADRLAVGEAAYDIAQVATPDCMKYREEESQC